MKILMPFMFICFMAGCAMFDNGAASSDDGAYSSPNTCQDSYDDVNSRCSGSIEPQTY
jgi:hypothetical protein